MVKKGKIFFTWHKIGRSIENLKMKNHLQNLMLIAGLLFLMNCSSQTANFTNLKREWMLVEFQDFSKDLMVKNKAKLDLSKTTNSDKQFTANMGCNGMFGQAKLKPKGEISFSQIGSTEMFCNENMNLETEFIKVLPTITTYKVEGHRLTLSNKNGAILKFVAADWD
jgi:heat shock protein HslJ